MLDLTVLLDVDETCAISNKHYGQQDGGVRYNDALFDALKQNQCTEVYFFTSFKLADLSPQLKDESCGTPSRLKLIQYLKEKGIKVKAVLTPLDVEFKQGVGAYYEQIIKPYEMRVLQGEDLRSGSAAEAYKKDYEQEIKLNAQSKNKIGDKGVLYQYFIETQRDTLLCPSFNIVFVDDRPACLQDVEGVNANKKYAYPLCLIQAKPQDTVLHYQKLLSDFQSKLAIRHITQQLEGINTSTLDKTQNDSYQILQQELRSISATPNLLALHTLSMKVSYFSLEIKKPYTLYASAQRATLNNPLLEDKQAECLIDAIKSMPDMTPLSHNSEPAAILYGLEKPYGISLKMAATMLRKINPTGNSLVGRVGKVFYKQNPEFSLVEQAVYQLSRLLGEKVVTPTRLLFLEICGKENQEILQASLGAQQQVLEMYALQASLGVGLDAGIEALDLDELCQIPEVIAALRQDLGERQFLEDFPVLLSNDYYKNWLMNQAYSIDMSITEQQNVLAKWFLSLTADRWPIGLRECYDLPGKPSLLQTRLKEAFEAKKAPLRIMALLERYPILSKNHLNHLIILCDALERLKFLYPNLAPELVLKEAEQLLSYIDKTNLSTQIVLEILTEPQDHKGDNFKVQFKRDTKGNLIAPLEIIAIDNDVAMDNVFKSAKEECSLRLMLNDIGTHAEAIHRGHEIIVVNTNDELKIFYKTINNNEIAHFNCSEKLKTLLSLLSFDGRLLANNTDTKSLRKQIYEEVASKGGCIKGIKHIVLAKSLLFANNTFLNEHIVDQLVQRLSLMNPKVAVMQWLEALEHYYAPYYALEDIIGKCKAKLTLDQQVSIDFIKRCLERLEILQNCLKQGPISHRTLWAQVDPLLAHRYQVLNQHYPSSQSMINALYNKREPVFFEDILSSGIEQRVDNGKTLSALIDVLPATDKNAGYRDYAEALIEQISDSLTINHLAQDALTLYMRLNFNRTIVPPAGLILSTATVIQAYAQAPQKWAYFIKSFPKIAVQFKVPLSFTHPLILYYAICEADGPVLIEALLAAGVAANSVRSGDGLTPLHFAASFYPDCIPALIAGGADIECRVQGMTPLEMAMHLYQHKAVLLLLHAGAGRDLDARLGLTFIETYQTLYPELCQSLLSRNIAMAWFLALDKVSQEARTPEGVSIMGMKSNRYLRSEVYKEIFKGAHTFPKDNIHGVRSVTSIKCRVNPSIEVGLHLKEYPELPGREIMVHLLAKHLFGGLTTPPIALWRFSKMSGIIKKKEVAYPVLASRSIEGKNLFEVIKENPEQLKKLDKQSVYEAIVLAMMINPEDGRADNYIVQPFSKGNEVFYRIVSIDNDHAFVRPIVFKKSGAELKGTKTLKVKTILYCLEEMQNALPYDMVKQLLSQKPYELLRHWLKELKRNQKNIDKFFNEKEKKELKSHDVHLDIAFKFSIVEDIYQKFCRLQMVLREDPRTPLFDILRAVIPELWIRYFSIFTQYDTPLDRFNALTKDSFATKVIKQGGNTLRYAISSTPAREVMDITVGLTEEETKKEKEESANTALSRLDQLYAECSAIATIADELQQGIVDRFKALPSIDQEKIINGDGLLRGIDFNLMPRAKQETVLAAFQGISFRALKIRNCSVLGDKQLSNLLQGNKSLLALTLEGCLSLTNAAVQKIDKHCPNLEKLHVNKLSWSDVSVSLPRLRALYVHDCALLKSWVLQSSSIVELLYFINCQGLYNVDISSTALREITLMHCPKLPEKKFRALASDTTFLKKVDLKGCLAIPNAHFYQKYPKLSNLPLQDFSSEFIGKLDEGIMLSLKDFGMPPLMIQPAMIKNLHDNLILWQSFKREQFFPLLLKVLEDKHPDIRKHACEALAKLPLTMEDRALVLPVLLRTLGDVYSDVRNCAVQALSNLLQSVTQDLITILPILLKQLGDKSRTVKSGVCEAFPKLSLKTEDIAFVLPILLKVLEDEYADVRSSAAQALSNMPFRLEDISIILPALINALSDENTEVRSRVSKALSKLPLTTEHLNTLLPTLIEKLADKNRNIRNGACEALSNLALKRAKDINDELSKQLLEALKEVLKMNKESDLKSHACGALAKLPLTEKDRYSEVFYLLLQALADTESDVRSHACEALSSLSLTAEYKKIAISALTKLELGEKNAYVRQSAAQSILKLSTMPEDTQPVLAEPKTLLESDLSIKNSAEETQLRPPLKTQDMINRITTLITVLEDENVKARAEAAEALLRLPLSAEDKIFMVLPTILKLLEHQSPEIRMQSVGLLVIFYPSTQQLVDASCHKFIAPRVQSIHAKPTAPTAIVGRDSVSSLPLNVSGLGNNCGLFALVLGIKRGLENTPSLKNKTKLPDYFDAIDLKCLDPDTELKETVEVGIKLRQELYHALMQDAQYKTRRYHNVVVVCREFLDEASSAIDMQAWLKITRAYREPLKKQWLGIIDILEQNYNSCENDYRNILSDNIIKAHDIEQLKAQLSKLIMDKPESKELNAFLDVYYKENTLSIVDLITLRRLYRSAWLGLTSGTSLERNKVSDCIEAIFKQKMLVFLKKPDGASFCKNLLLLSLLEKSNFDRNGSCNNNLRKEEVLSMASALFIENDLIYHWDKLYQHYCAYIKTSTEMLGADELGCLAHYWNIQLKIQFAYGAPYLTGETVNIEQLQVTLCNPSRAHWNVICDTGIQFDMKWDSSKVVALILAIENVAYKTHIIDAINNEVAYAQRSEDCSYVMGVVSAIQEMPHVLLQQGISLSAADQNTAKLLSQYCEQGFLRLNAERLYFLNNFLGKDVFKSLDLVSVGSGEAPSVAQNLLLFDYHNANSSATTTKFSFGTRVRTKAVSNAHANLKPYLGADSEN